MSAPLRVISLGTLYPPYAIGGYEVVWRDTVNRLRRDGHEVKILASTWTVSNNGEDEDPDIRRELELYIDDLLDVVKESRDETVKREAHNRKLVDEVLDEFEPDVAFLGPVGGLPLSLLTRLRERGVPQLAFVGDEWPKYAPKADPGQRLMGLAGRLFGRASREGIEGRHFHYGDVDRWVCGSDRSATVLRRAGADPSTMTVLKPGPDTRRFTRQGPRPWDGRLLYAGRLHQNKGVEHAIRALAEAPKCRLAIAGTGDPRYAEKLERIAAEAGVDNRVKMLGEQRDQLPELYAEADAIVFPSVWKEPWGLVPLEAMAVGRPVIATAVGGPAEYLRDGENAIVVPPSDPAAIARAAKRLAADEDLRAKLVETGFTTADEYRYDRFLDRLAGAVVALGEEPDEEDEETSVSEAPEHEAAKTPQTEGMEEKVEDREPAAVPEPASPPGEAAPALPPRPEPAQSEPQLHHPAQPELQVQQLEPAQPEPETELHQREPAPAPQPAEPQPPQPPEPQEPEPQPAATQSTPEDANGETPDVDEWLPEGYELVEKDPPMTRAETTEWAAIGRAAVVPRGRPVTEEAAVDAPGAATPPTPVTRPVTRPVPAPAPGPDVSLIARLAALEVRVGELSTTAAGGLERSGAELAAIERRLGELSKSALAGIERNASELATLEGRVGELATSAVAGVERNAAELAAIEKRVGELTRSAVSGVERNASELATLEGRVSELASMLAERNPLELAEQNASALAALETRIGELATSAATAREHQGTELGSLQTRVGELAAFAELRGEALGQRIDELERTLGGVEASWRQAMDDVGARLGSIEQRLAEPLAEHAVRLERVERLAAEAWEREAAEAPRRASLDELEGLEGMAKLNEASFEQLRALGLSGTQAARLLAAREVRSGFDSVEDLEGLPGFPPSLIAELKQLVES